MGSPQRVFRVRAGRRSPGAEQVAEDAAGPLPDVLMDALTAWWRRCALPAHCPGPSDGGVRDLRAPSGCR